MELKVRRKSIKWRKPATRASRAIANGQFVMKCSQNKQFKSNRIVSFYFLFIHVHCSCSVHFFPSDPLLRLHYVFFYLIAAIVPWMVDLIWNVCTSTSFTHSFLFPCRVHHSSTENHFDHTFILTNRKTAGAYQTKNRERDGVRRALRDDTVINLNNFT